MKTWLAWCSAAALVACSSADDAPSRDSGNFNFGASGGALTSGGVAGSGGSFPSGGTAFTGGVAVSGGTQQTSGGSILPKGCSSATIEPKVNRSPGNLLVIFDRSLSMRENFEGNTSRFDAVDNALKTGLANFQCPPQVVDGETCTEDLTVGSILFPSVDALGCAPVDAIDATTQIYWRPVSEFLNEWQTYWQPGGPNARLLIGTPIELAFQRGDEAITASTLPGNTAVLFLTDGETTCVPGDPIDAVAQAQTWANNGVTTYVVSVGDLGSAFNDQVAQAGGSGNSINPDDSQQLNDAIAGIVQQTAQLVDCKTTLQGQKIVDQTGACERGTVILGTAQVPCDAANGFQVISDSEMELFGTACESLKTGQKLTAEFPCDVLLE